MPVTELVHFTTRSGAVTPAYLAAIGNAIKVQDQWCAENLSASSTVSMSPGSRGAALFQQLGSPSSTLLTAHWDSAEQHGVWIASAANQGVLAQVLEHIDPAKLVFFHVEGLSAFSGPGQQPGATEGPDGATSGAGSEKSTREVPTLQAPVVSVATFSVAPGRKDEFERISAALRAVHDEFARPFVHRGGWRIEKESEDKEEFVLIGGWESVEKARDFSKSEEFKSFDETIKGVVTVQDVKYYKKLI